MKHIMYIEDEVDIGKWGKEELEKQGYRVTWLLSGEGSGDILETADCVLLDAMLPVLDGFTLGQRFKREQPDIPIIMLTARTMLDDKLHGLTFADDYITKPFHPKELVARIEVLLRRYDKVDKNVQHIQHLRVNMKEQRIIRTDTEEEVVLSGKQHHLFFFFMRHLNQTLTKEQLFEAIWKLDYIEGDKTLMVHIRYLREKIERNPSEPTIIETIRGIGYRFKS
ncbi:response regulator transcription factor [Priestia taiwanensis]|uniref:DNA-binding response regulator n=1 Tax=Priestia taiwanensis TaxID=1347902 RepID=A0A917EU64_9BACI|nr:response regulator transcription factor [Priestia taiwanensis]MBM7365010.1 DNA-binding response OmpR family regulator [Priestia taiwanensis]GGE83330.1 DNA-binding response regulator [Priestia taiwanensis]